MIPRKYMHEKGNLKTIKTRCKPPQDCFFCKYPDCVAGDKKPTTEEQIFYSASFTTKKRGTKC